MKSRQFLMAGLIAVILIPGLLSVMHSDSPLLASLIWTGVLTLLIGAALVAVLDTRRTFWVGFAVVGLVFAFFAGQPLSWDRSEHPLLTTQILSRMFTAFGHHSMEMENGIPVSLNPFATFHRIGQALAVLLHAIVGGLLANWLRPRLHSGRGLDP